MVEQLIVGGIGPGTESFIVPELQTQVDKADVLAGGGRALALFPRFAGETIRITKDLASLFTQLRDCLVQGKSIVVLVSGDPGSFSLLPRLTAEFGEQSIAVVPGTSSVQLAAARLKTTWVDGAILSCHHQLPDGFCATLANNPKSFVLTGPTYDPAFLLELLQEHGLIHCRFSLCCDLGYPTEEVRSYELGGLTPEQFQQIVDQVAPYQTRLVVCVIEQRLANQPKTIEYGLSDQRFLTECVPMTKEEIRAISLSKLNLRPHSIVFDIGCGTGTIAIQAAMFAHRGWVYAWDKNPDAVHLTKQNAAKLALQNISVFSGSAPEDFPDDCADAIFIGGTAGTLPPTMDRCLSRLRPGGTIVLNAVTMETLAQVWMYVQERHDLEVEMLSVTVAKTNRRGAYHMWKAQNPIYICKIQRHGPDGSS